MAQLANFTGTTPRFALPYLFAGQAQKEFFVNEAHAITDLLLQPVVEGETNTPPVTPATGESWLVSNNPTGAWVQNEGSLAGFYGGTWLFVPPTEGLRIWDKATRQILVYRDTWLRAAEPTATTGGGIVDTELRAAFSDLIEALKISGIFPA